MIDSQLKKNLQKLRDESGKTQLEIANKVGIHVNYYARIERGRVPGIKTLQKLAKVFGVQVSDLITL